MRPFTADLDWVARQRARMEGLVREWASIPSQTYDVAGLSAMADSVSASFASLGPVEPIALPPVVGVDSRGEPETRPLGRALRVSRRAHHARRVFLGVHMDTVHARDSAPPLELIAPGCLRGPGVTDAKGGLAILRIALEALERSPLAETIGWDVVVNPDEEIGSPGSASCLVDAARRTGVGLVFEPPLPDGTLVGARKGSGTFAAVVRGRAAHVGRDFPSGRSAIRAAARLITELEALNDATSGVIVNVGEVVAGRAVNIVPDLAVVRFNVRCDQTEDQSGLESAIATIVRASGGEGIHSTLHGGFTAPAKPLDEPTTALLEAIAACGRELGSDIHWRSTGGVSDGNRLAAAGLTTVDTLGARGGHIHTPDEYLILDSLVERARLATLVLLRLAAGEIAWPGVRAMSP